MIKRRSLGWVWPNPTVDLAPYGRWTLRDKAAQRRSPSRWASAGSVSNPAPSVILGAVGHAMSPSHQRRVAEGAQAIDKGVAARTSHGANRQRVATIRERQLEVVSRQEARERREATSRWPDKR